MPRPMYFFAIDTTSRRLADVSCSRASRPIRTTSPRRSRIFVCGGTSGSKPIRRSRSESLPGDDPALEGPERDLVPRPVVDRPQADVVARVEVAVVHRQVRPVEQLLERLGVELRVVAGDQPLGGLEQRGRAVRLGVLAGLDQVEVGRGDQQLGGVGRGQRVGDHLVGLGPERQPVLGLGRPGLALGVVERPLVERDDRLPGLDDDLLAELDGLGEDDLLLGREERDLADLLEVHPDRVVDPDHVRGQGLELLGRRLLDFLGVELGRRVHAGRDHVGVGGLDRLLGRRPRRSAPPCWARRPRRADRSMSSSSRSSSSTSSETGAATPSARRGRIEASFASSSSRRVRRGRDASTASTSCLSRGSAMSAGPPSSSDAGSVRVEVSPPPPACGRGVGSGRGAGRATGAVR